MTRLSYRLAKAVSDGREARGKPSSREEVLARLLKKRATAQQAGLEKLESSLRHQISWALPMRKGDEAEDISDETPPSAES